MGVQELNGIGKTLRRNQATYPLPCPSPSRDCVTMSLRGSEATEAISYGVENKEIATLPLVARNDKMELRHSPQGERGDNF